MQKWCDKKSAQIENTALCQTIAHTNADIIFIGCTSVDEMINLYDAFNTFKRAIEKGGHTYINHLTLGQLTIDYDKSKNLLTIAPNTINLDNVLC